MNSFCGREKILTDIRNIIKDSNNKSIVNIYGIGGIGKTTLFQYVKEEACENGASTAVVDFKNNNIDVFDIITLMKNELKITSVLSSDAFKEYDSIQKKFAKSEERLLKCIKKNPNNNLKEYLPEAVSASTEAIGTITGEAIAAKTTSAAIMGVSLGSIGGAIGALASVGIGIGVAKMIEHCQHHGITALNKIGLSKKDIDVFINYKTELTNSFINGINNLVNMQTTPVILCFDTYEKVPSLIEKWIIEELVEKLNNNVILFFCGRESLKKNILWSDFFSIMNNIEVSPFSEKESLQYLEKKGISDDTSIKNIINYTRSLPWALALIVDLINDCNISLEDIDIEKIDNDQIGERVVGRFLDHINDSNLKKAINLCSMTNYFTFEILKEYFKDLNNDEVKDIFRKIKAFSFTRELGNNQFVIHDVVSCFLIKGLKRFNNEEYIKQHKFYSEYFLEQSKISNNMENKAKLQWEFIFHCLKYNEIAALSIVDSYFNDTSEIVPLDIMGEYLYTGLSQFEFETSDRLGLLYKDYSTAQIMMKIGNWELAVHLFSQVLNNKQIHKSIILLENSSFALSDIYIGQGHYKKAKSILENLLNKSKNISNRNKKKIGAKLNEVYAILGQYRKGEKLAIDSKILSENENDFVGMAWAYKSLGDIYRLWGYSNKAISALKHGLSIFIDQEDAFGEAIIRTQLARNYTHTGKWTEAEEELNVSEGIYKKYNYKYGLANCYLFKGNINRCAHKWDNALNNYKIALKYHQEMNSEREIGPIWGSMGIVYFGKGNKEKAEEYLNKSINLKESQGYTRGVMLSLMYRGDCYLAESKYSEAKTLYLEARNMIKTAKPIYVCSELDMKIFICRLANNEILNDDIDNTYNKIKKNLIKFEYYHLAAMLNFYFWYAQKNLEFTKSLSIIKNCLELSTKYNSFLEDFYHKRIIEIASKRYNKKDFSYLKNIMDIYKS